ncbi:unnamed protein product [Arctia plantaginis]|uniref:Reverse transcriptase RNase H-like domain-containing protein n=1 Tax=Arctia plantaginis TaxID=874455 RepID=A0A8S0ZKS5_ARCPL|nr:unnamed protein product [Arctia plantaginis]
MSVSKELSADASQYAIGAALVQGEGEHEHPIENASRLLTPALKQLAQDLALAKENIEDNLESNRFKANAKRRPDPGCKFGNLVLVETHPISNSEKQFSAKFAPRRDGPYIIVKKHGATTYEVAHPDTPERSIGRYHTSAITKFERRADDLPNSVNPICRRGGPRKGAGALAGR